MPPRTSRPPRHRPRTSAMIASARRVPPSIDERRSWLPPVMNTPVASRTMRAACSSLACMRVTALSGMHLGRPELGEHGPVPLARLEPEGARRGDHGDPCVPTAGERDEPAEDDPVPDLVLRPADDDDGPVRHGARSLAARPAATRTRRVRAGAVRPRQARMRTDASAHRPPATPSPPGRRRPARPAARGDPDPRAQADRRHGDPDRRVRAGPRRHGGAGRHGGRRRPGVLGGGPDLARGRRPVPSHRARSCPTSMRRGCCRCSPPGRCCPGRSPGSPGAGRRSCCSCGPSAGPMPVGRCRPRSPSACSPSRWPRTSTPGTSTCCSRLALFGAQFTGPRAGRR